MPSSIEPVACAELVPARTSDCERRFDTAESESAVVRQRLHSQSSSLDSTARQLTAAVLHEMVHHSEFFQRHKTVPPLPTFASSGRLIVVKFLFSLKLFSLTSIVLT